MRLACLLALLIPIPSTWGAQGDPTPIALWPDTPPGETTPIGPERDLPAKAEARPVRRITDVSKPTLTVFKAPGNPTHTTAVVICPGGGYSILAWDLEGEEVAAWLNNRGVTAFVLKYRVPARPNRPRWEAPLQDAQRAVSMVRHRAAEFGVDPNRIGILGFSAGGNLAALCSTRSAIRSYPTRDPIDQVSCRPDFTILIYPAYLAGSEAEAFRLAPEVTVSDKSPPTFFAHATDDPISPMNSVVLYQALKGAGVPAELHIYAQGGHGFGLRPSDLPCSRWPDRCAEWMTARGLMPELVLPP